MNFDAFKFFLLIIIFFITVLKNPVRNNHKKSNKTLLRVTLNSNNLLRSIYQNKQIVHEKLFDLDNFTFILNSALCNNEETVIILIHSNPKNLHFRKVVRNTWGRQTKYSKHVFLIGETNGAISKEIKEEHAKYNDIVQGNFIDSYKNLTYKHIMGLKWVKHYCPHAKFVLKTDDDVFIHIYELKEVLDNRLDVENDAISCMVNFDQPVVRKKRSKYYVSKDEYPERFYPDYCSGFLILYSRKVIDRLIIASEQEKYFFIDDIYVTGILRKKLNISLTEISDLFLRQERMNLLFRKGFKEAGTFMFGPQDLKVDDILKLWNITEEYRIQRELDVEKCVNSTDDKVKKECCFDPYKAICWED